MQASETGGLRQVTRPSSRSGDSSASSGRRVNDILCWCLIAILALAPIPLGSNRPFFWAAWGTVVGMLAVIYFWIMQRGGHKMRAPLSSLRIETALFGLFCTFLVVQTLPIAGALGLGTMISTAHTLPTISIAPGATFLMLIRMVTYGLFYLLVMQVCRNDSRRALLLNALLFIIAVYAAVGLISLAAGDTILGLPKWAYEGSATGTFINRNSYATFLAFGATLAAAQVAGRLRGTVSDPRQRSRSDVTGIVLYLAVYALILSATVATQSRMGLFVAVVGTVTPLLLSMLTGLRKTLPAIAATAVALLALAAGLMLYGSALFDRLGDVDRAADVRTDLYAQILHLIMQRPLTGFGGGSFELAFPLVHALPVNPDVVWDKAHNTYLALWAETGLLFGSIPIVLFLIAAQRLRASLFSGQFGWTAQAAALSVLLVGGLHSLVDFSLEIQANTFVFLAVMAAGTAATFTSAAKSDARHV